MRVMVGIGEVYAEVEDDQSYVPEVVADVLSRAAHSALTLYLALPDAVPVEDE